jgi:hypothetical protein
LPTREEFQRLLMMSEPEILPLNAQAALGPVRMPPRSQFGHLYRHFLERFFSHETASPDGDAKTRMVQVAFAAGLPGFAVALYLFPVYHPFPGWPPGTHNYGPPSYWIQISHHLFFVMYAFVSMGIATVFEWDMFFPDLLDVLVLGTLPIAERRVFLARVTAIAIFIGGFLLDANFLAPLVLPSTTEPPDLARFLAGHLAAVALSGLFAAVFVLAVQSVLIALVGERWFRKFSVLLQGFAIAFLLIPLLLFPVFSGIVPALLESGDTSAFWFPPFWFLGIYQRVLEGPGALPVFSSLANVGLAATGIAVLVALVNYPAAYLRKVRGLVEGAGARSTRSWVAIPIERVLNATLLRQGTRRAVFHFISRTILRVTRYRIYLVLYGGVGASLVAASLLRFTISHHHVSFVISAEGIRAAVAIVAFWTVAGLRMSFVSPGNERGSWVFDIVHGKPAQFAAAMDELAAPQLWVLLAAVTGTLGTWALLLPLSPMEMQTLPALAAQLVVVCGLSLLLTDVFFLHVGTIAFTGEATNRHSNLAMTVLKYYAFFPFVTVLPGMCEPWIAESTLNFAMALVGIAAAHWALKAWHRARVRERCAMPAMEGEDEDSPLRLGLLG